MSEALIVSAVRTPIGRATKGSLRDIRPDDLVAMAIGSAVERAGIDPGLFSDHCLGTAYPEGKQGANLARRASLLAGLPVELPGCTVNRFCASSMQALRTGVHAIWASEATGYLVSGVESISQVGRTTREEDKHPAFLDGRLPEVYISMGETAERVADSYGISREDMDLFAVESHRKALAAQETGLLARSMVPVVRPDGAVIDTDDGPRRDTSVERLAALPAAFRPGGRITAGNACPLNDGAAAAVLVSDETAAREGLEPRARVVATGVSGVDPSIMGVGPIGAIRDVLARAKLAIGDMDVVEFNEAFASQVLAVSRAVGIDIDGQLNPAGGAIALGHPFGMTGVRLICSLLDNLDVCGGRYGLATLCVGGGQGMAMVLEKI
jgi:acetyl-CoA C-acetyltransferase